MAAVALPPAGLMAQISTWVNINAARIRAARAWDGGWEGWFQVELALALQALQTPGQMVLREHRIFAGEYQGQIIDLWLPNHHGIELKCRSKNDTGNGTWKNKMMKDMEKLIADSLHEDYRPATTWAIGITMDGNDENGWAKIIGQGSTVYWHSLAADIHLVWIEVYAAR